MTFLMLLALAGCGGGSVAVRTLRRARICRRPGLRHGGADGADLDGRGDHRERLGAVVIPQPIRRAVDAAGLVVSDRAVVAIAVGTAAVGAGAGVQLAGLTGLAAGGPLGLALLTALVWMLRGRADRRLVAGLPDALDSLGRAVRSGASIRAAIIETAPMVGTDLRREFDRIGRELALGQPFVDALNRWVRRRPLPEIRLTAAALGFAVDAGGAQARTLDGLAQSIRDRMALADEVRALASQARMSAMVMAVLPLGFLVLSMASDEATMHFLSGTAAGRLCLVGGLVLDAAGLGWMHRMTANP